MKKILISACLIGDKVRYDGGHNKSLLIDQLLEKYELVPFCPEVEGGLSVPREVAERKGKDKVITIKGRDVTRNYLEAAQKAYLICSYLGIETAILKEGSPACGVHEIYDGTFTHKKIKGKGFVAEYLSKKGIKIISEDEIENLLKEE